MRLPSSGPAPIDTVAEDMAAFGVRDFTPPAWMLEDEDEDPEEFGILPENWEAANAFLACNTQWRHGPAGVPSGLRYEGVEVVLRTRGVQNMEDIFVRVQIMEGAAVREFVKLARRKR